MESLRMLLSRKENSMYADARYYKDTYRGTSVPEGEIEKMLERAGRQIDTLTFCRIRGKGLENLTPFQQKQIRYVNCLLADFLFENQEELETLLSSYSINGASMSFGGGINVTAVQGVILRTDIYAELVKTGLCCRGL